MESEIADALTREHYRRARARIEASPEDHCAASAAAVMLVVGPKLEQLHDELTRRREAHQADIFRLEQQRTDATAECVRLRAERDAFKAVITHLSAEAHRRKWAYPEVNSAAFDELHRLGNELIAALGAISSPVDKDSANDG